MKNKADYSKYKCPYAHLDKELGHKLEGPEGYEETYGVWCACGFRGPVFYIDPKELNLELINKPLTRKENRDMKVMANHKWFDGDIDEVLWDHDDDVRELILLSDTQALNISKNDVIALAKEFGLVVYNQGDNL